MELIGHYHKTKAFNAVFNLVEIMTVDRAEKVAEDAGLFSSSFDKLLRGNGVEGYYDQFRILFDDPYKHDFFLSHLNDKVVLYSEKELYKYNAVLPKFEKKFSINEITKFYDPLYKGDIQEVMILWLNDGLCENIVDTVLKSCKKISFIRHLVKTFLKYPPHYNFRVGWPIWEYKFILLLKNEYYLFYQLTNKRKDGYELKKCVEVE